MRMSPVVPASVLNYAAGCTSMDLWRFALGSLCGFAPGTTASAPTPFALLCFRQKFANFRLS